ncbi:carboxylesterase family protein [Aspergillus ellipticus CBS 707.79]|uniref:Carboxylic ester hydrolase n=1 Tax=Aspergillus ellipticus CBS 707.79 TaxID=1448320 RepID=A0A319DRG9_9EURO|nr:carboxylesterase family protein [Aspergillus ellipticus CBS 707.79]
MYPWTGTIYIFPLLVVLPTWTVASSLPVVDLGYELHQAIALDESIQAYNFSNIRYAAPPTGTRRFLPPSPPTEDRGEIQSGSVGRVCPQASLTWEMAIMVPFLDSMASGTEFHGSSIVGDYPAVELAQDSRVTEDCLFLDVIVPKSVFERGAEDGGAKNTSLAPVLVWIDGGGYISGDKTEKDPTGLLQQGIDKEKEFVFVALNYRVSLIRPQEKCVSLTGKLGAFGWLSDISGEGFANAGLYDQRLALEWVREHIALFGGDPARVTVMGESAGGGSVIHQLAAYGGNGTNSDEGELPFHQAIIQSPVWYPQSTQQQESARRQFLELLNVTSIEEARSLESNQLIAANAEQIASTSAYGTFTYGPVVDGTFAPDLPSRILLDPSFKWKHLRVLSSHTSDEGLAFIPPAGMNSSAYESIIEAYFPGLLPETMGNISQTLYPPVYNSSSPQNPEYGSPMERASLTVSDAFFQCKNLYLNTIFNTTYAYVFNMPPGLHAQDIPFTFYNHSVPDVEAEFFDEDLALTMQDHIVSFVREGVPSPQATPWEAYEEHGRVLSLASKNVTMIPDPVDNSRCRLWWEWSG